MNYKVLVLIIMGIVFVFDTLKHYFEFKSAEREIPANVADIYDAEEYKRWAAYDKERNKLALWRHLVSSLVSFLLIALDGYAAIVNLIGAKGLYSAALTIMIGEIVIDRLWSTPFSYVEDMVIEQKYGFNKMTKKTFASDVIKELIISLCWNCALVCIVIVLHQAMGNWLLISFTIVILVISIIGVFLQPVLVRVSNKLTPLPEGELRTRLTDLLAKNNCTVRQISVSDGSKRSTKANAFFGGFGKMKTIVLYDTLLEQMAEDEIVAVFAHEMGHNKNKDTIRLFCVNVWKILLMVVLLWAVVSLPEVYKDFGFDGLNYGLAFALAGVGLGFISPLMDMLQSGMSRKFEYAADKFAADNGYGAALISGLKKLAKNSFDCLTPHPVVVVLTHDHPTVSQRIEHIEKCMKNKEDK